MTQVACLTFHCNLQGALIKINPLEKISYFRTCSRFLVLNRKFFGGGFMPYKQQISLQYQV